MNTTLFGKLFVFVNLVFSIVLAALALGIFTNRIDWPGGGPTTIPGEKAVGEAKLRETEIRDQEKVAGLALTRWQAERATLLNVEQQLPLARRWYAEKLRSIAEAPAQGSIQPAENNFPAPRGVDSRVPDAWTNFMKTLTTREAAALGDIVKVVGPDAKTLWSRKVFLENIQAANTKIQQDIAKAKDYLERAQALTLEINGIKGTQKGLRDLLAEVDFDHRHALEEMEYLKPFRYNRQVESGLLLKRQVALKARIAELEKANAALQQ